MPLKRPFRRRPANGIQPPTPVSRHGRVIGGAADEEWRIGAPQETPVAIKRRAEYGRIAVAALEPDIGVRLRCVGRSLAITEPMPGASSRAFFWPHRMLCIASGWFRIGVSCVIDRMSV